MALKSEGLAGEAFTILLTSPHLIIPPRHARVYIIAWFIVTGPGALNSQGKKKINLILIFVYCFLGSHRLPFLPPFGNKRQTSERAQLGAQLWACLTIFYATLTCWWSPGPQGRSVHHPTCSSSPRGRGQPHHARVKLMITWLPITSTPRCAPPKSLSVTIFMYSNRSTSDC